MKPALLIAVIAFGSQAYSDLYVSPYKGDGQVRYADNPNTKSGTAPKVNSESRSSQSSDGNLMERFDGQIARRELGSGANASNGKDVPVAAAMKMLFPDDDWTINVDRSLGDDAPVSWSVSGKQPDVIQAMAKQNGLYVAVNDDERSVGVSEDPKLAPLLAHKVPMVWWVDPAFTMSEQVEEWARLAGWRTSWLPSRDFYLEHPAVLTGTLQDAVSQLIGSVADTDLPLRATTSPNNVIAIMQGGWDAP